MKISIFNNIFDGYLTTNRCSTTEENENDYIIEFSKNESLSSKDLEVNTVTDEKNDEKLVSILVSNNLKRMRKEYGGGFDQREIGKTCLEKIYDQVQENNTLNKLRKYNYQMNLLKKLENVGVSDFEKIKAIEEYKYVMESSKYVPNIESGGLYKNWCNNNF
jgi:hypothetical protein